MPALSPLHFASYREWPYNYGDAEDYLGYEAFVVKHAGDKVTIVRHRLHRIVTVELTTAEFMETYCPDFTLTPAQMAREFINFMTFMQPTVEAREHIIAHTKINYSDKEFKMGKPQRATKTATKSAVKSAKKPVDVAGVYADSHRRTCIKIADDGEQVTFIPLTNDGFEIERLDHTEFNKTFRELQDYPVERAARLYVEYSLALGGTKEALKALGQFTTVTDKEITMATTKRAARGGATKPAAKSAAKPVAKKAAATKTPTKATVEKKPTARQQGAAAKKEKGVSAAQRFQELIMEGKKTDDQIFAAVQKEFGLDDNKRSYVKWYRNHLIKNGKKPPAAK